MSWWDAIRSRFGDEAHEMLYLPIPRDRIDRPGPDIELRPDASYFRLWLDQMALANPRSWGKDRFPAVHSEVRVRLAGRDDLAFSRVARPKEGALAPGVRLNYELTPLMPFNGGTVEVEAALASVQGRDLLGPVIDVLKEVGGLVAPPLGQAVGLAQTVSNALRQLLDGNAEAELGLHQTLASGDGGGSAVLRPGTVAVIARPRKELEPARLRVVEHQLVAPTADEPEAPLREHDFMLLRVEGRDERDDLRLPDIDAPLKSALIALEEGNITMASGYRAVALAAAWRSPDIAEADRRRVIDAIKSKYAEAEKGDARGATGAARERLTDVMGRLSQSRDRAGALGPVSERELFV